MKAAGKRCGYSLQRPAPRIDVVTARNAELGIPA